ncbi:hypothetical protein EHS25_008478 [Saitozyma podzolica]|uniref:PUB domain-containing protein n=1 Tax=Saitozyma podzolica TaxID=1890683 RepID=A0A427YLW3_9TREE|nr:hypothetical protein EHS25_008478 [Saitozyma podzolica]
MDAPTTPAPARLNPRAAALAAAEARLRPSPIAAETASASASASASSSAIPASTSSIPPSGTLLSGASSPGSGPGTSTPTLRGDSSPGGVFDGARGLAGAAGTRSPPVSAWTPTEKGDRETRKEFARLLDRGIVRDNGYRDAAAAVETLLTIANNVIGQSDPKYRDLKASNSTLKNKVLAVKGGHEYLIRLGFRTSTIDFTQHFIFQPSVRRMHELKIGKDVLAEHLMMLMLLLPRPRRSPLYRISRRLHHVAFTVSHPSLNFAVLARHRTLPRLVHDLAWICLADDTLALTLPFIQPHHQSPTKPRRLQPSLLPSLQLDNLQARANLTSTSRTLASADEAERRAKALREIEDDRDQVRDRVNRERRMRDREERLAREQAEQAAWSAHADAEGGAGTGSGSGGQPEWFGEDGHDDDEMDQEDEMVLQGGRRLDS